MARSSSPGHGKEHKHKHRDRDKGDRDRRDSRDHNHKDHERRDGDKDRDRHRDRDKERDRDRGKSERQRDRGHDDREKERRREHRSRSRSKSPGDRERKRRRKDEEQQPALTKEQQEKKRKEEEQAALEAEMERRRQRVEEWRKKKQQEEMLAQQQQQQAEQQQRQQEQEQADHKGWTLSDDDDLEDEDQDMQQQANGSSPAAAEDGKEAPTGAAALQQPEQQQQLQAQLQQISDDDVDPLDAFMAGNEQAFKQDLNAAEQLRQEDQLRRQQQQQQAEEEEEVDPLDAFMAQTVLPKASSAIAAALKQQQMGGASAAVKEEQQEQVAVGPVKVENGQRLVAGAIAAAPAAVAPKRRPPVRRRYHSDSSDESSDEMASDSDDEEWAKAVTAGKLSKSDKLGVVDHSTIKYPPFRKNFYIEVPELAKLSAAEVEQLRKELDGIKVRGLNAPKPVRGWTQCGLSSRVMEVLRKAGFDRPLPIQAQALPTIMSGRDCIGIAKTGSGKTLAFVVPMLRHIKDQRPIQQGDGPIALVMAPTRELVNQITKEVKVFAKPLGLAAVAVFGGSGVANQIRELKRGAEVVACTPGRMIDLLATGSGRITNLRRVTYMVLDEADRMFDMGFEPQIMRIVNNIRPDRQTVLFSATFPRQVEALARTILQDPVEIQVGGRSVVNRDIEQFVEMRPEEERFLRMLEILGEWYERGKIIIFVHSQDKCDTLFRDLLKSGYPCLSLHGGKDQADRECTIADFKGNVCNILVATSVAARGLDVKDLVLVVNYDVPNHHEDYVHRVGRTGRAGNKGTAITFIGPDEERYAPDLVKALRESSAPVAQDLQAMADAFASKRKAGLVQGHGSGYGGSGFKFDASEEDQHKQARKAEAKKYGVGGEEGSEPGSDSDDDIRPAGASAAAAAAAAVLAGTQPGAVVQPAAVGGAAAAAAAPETTSGHQPAAPQTNEELLLAAQRAAMQLLGNGPITGNVASFAAAAAARAAALAAAWGHTTGVAVPTQSVGTSAAPMAPAFETTLDINDFPQHARWKVTHKDAMAMITELTGAAVTTKGIYIAPGRAVPEGESRLHLLIEGPTELTVKRAKQEIKRILEETTEKVMRRDAPAAGGKYSVM